MKYINTKKRPTSIRSLLLGIVVLGTGISSSNAAVMTQPSGLNNGDQYRLIFVTSTTRDATSTNIADYNNFVAGVAATVPALVGLGTTWTAVVSTPTVAAVTNTGTDWTPAGATGVIIRTTDLPTIDLMADVIGTHEGLD